MNESPRDALLVVGKTLTKLIQWLCALAGCAALLLVPIVLLISQDMLPGFGGADRSETIAASPLSVLAIVMMFVLMLAALFQFFGKLRAIIASVGEGDPFTPENATRLVTMAWLFLGVKILTVMVGAVRLHLATLVDKNANGIRSLDFSLYDLDAVLIVIVLFILARIFRHGAAMREDLTGTV